MTTEPPPALQLQQLRKRFGTTEVLRGVDLSVRRGERHAVIGPNGAGKSTVFDLVSGRSRPSGGDILLEGRSIAGLPPFAIHRRGLARSFQITHLFPRLPVQENLRCAVLSGLGHRRAFWRAVSGLPDVRERVDEVLERIGLQARRDLPAGALSYAEQRALEIGITIAGGATVLLLDEPTAGMSRAESERAVALIRAVSEGRTLLLVEHDMGVVFDLADRVSVLVQGRVLATGSPAQVRADSAVQAAYLGDAVDA